MLEIVTPATDPWLLTLAQTKAAAGVDPGVTTRDDEMNALRATVSAVIYDALNIAVGTGSEPTIRQEVLRETVLAPAAGPIILSRRHNVVVSGIEGWHGGTTAADYYVDAEAGLIHRPDRHRWGCLGGGCGRATVEYTAGFEEVPPVLVSAATDLVRLRVSETDRDPLVKREIVDIDGIDRIEKEFWVTAAGATEQTSSVPPIILATLKRFRNSAYA